MQFRDLKKQYEVLKPQMDAAMLEVAASSQYIGGPQVKTLETRLAEYVGVKHCITCGNGTDALQLALMAVLVDAVVVEDAISDVARLLYLGDEISGTDGMDAACWQEEHLPTMRSVVVHDIHDGAISHTTVIFLRSDVATESRHDLRSWLMVDDIPHLSFAATTVHTLRHHVIRMHLHREVAARVNQLDQQRELVAMLTVHSLTHQFSTMTLNKLGQCQPIVWTAVNHRLMALDTRQFPTLAYLMKFRVYALEGNNLLATPNHGLEQWPKFVWS